MLRILWADDQIDVIKSFSPILGVTGSLIEFVDNGEDALKLITSDHFDLMLLDLAMPPNRWGGIWVLEELKKRSISIPVIVVSGEGMQSETIQALRLGAVDYVTKEQISEELPRQITSALENLKNDHDVIKLISNGESDSLEFKSTLRMNLFSGKPDGNIELSALKTIAGFLNSNGGTLLLGVNDSGDIVGIEKDSFKDLDKFQIHFWNLIREAIGAEFTSFLVSGVYVKNEGSIFSVTCKKSNRPVFVKWKNPGESKHSDLFFVRSGPQTEQLGTRQAVLYISDHFKT
jgi:CheY-like chemotaxis protein